jgi:hypothetical protein
LLLVSTQTGRGGRLTIACSLHANLNYLPEEETEEVHGYQYKEAENLSKIADDVCFEVCALKLDER